ncbi:MAG: DoxX family protein [Chloroflexia bacterium]
MKFSTGSIIMIVIATLMGLFFGNALGGLLWGLVVGLISAAGAFYSIWRYEQTGAKTVKTEGGELQDPRFARFLFSDPRSAIFWLPVRIFVGWQWLMAGWHKFEDPRWLDNGQALLGYWQGAVKVPEGGRAPITYDWWRGFIQFLIDNEAHVWFAKVITFGEMLAGIGLIAGGLVGIAAFGGALMNMSFLLSGSTSTNPIMLLLAIGLMLAWKVAGWIGVDRVLLPALGTPWQAGALIKREREQSPQMIS